MRKFINTRSVSRKVLPVCIAVVTAVGLSACGSGGSDDSQVASLSGKGSASQPRPTSSTSTAEDSSRPQLRLDTSQEERLRLLKIWYACLAEHGHRMYEGDRSPMQKNLTPQDKAAKKACKGKDPLRPPQLVREKNPNYLDDYHKYIECLHGKGMNVQPVKPFGTGWNYGSNPPPQTAKIDKECKISAFG